MVKIKNIQWDIDEDCQDCNLPDEIVLDINEADVDSDYISDILSDKYGFCHKGFEIETVK